MRDLYSTIQDWLLSQALSDDDFSLTLKGLASRLLDGGVPVARISVGRTVLHPVIGLLDAQWDRDTGQVSMQAVPRNFVRQQIDLNNPFAELSKGTISSISADLTDPEDVARFPIFADLAGRGFTGYVAFSREFGFRQTLYERLSPTFRGASTSFATKRFSGFSAANLAGLERLIPALCVCARVDIERFLAAEILETYLGRASGQRVLTGQVERGDVQNIECAIFYSDMRGSLEMSQTLDAQAYLDTVNAYFECTARAVSDHGGEVLKFIGDGVLAIFPIEAGTRSRTDMCAAALASAREAFARADHTNGLRAAQGLPPVRFGVALHVGDVIYGNVGIEKRLDFTATGPQVGLAARIEGLTRTLDAPILASDAFAAVLREQGTEHPAQHLRSFDAPVTVVSFALGEP